MKQQGGFSIVELMVAIFLGLIVMAYATYGAMEKLDDSRVEASILKAKRIINAAEFIRKQVIDSSQGADGSYDYTFDTLTEGSSVADLEALIDADIDLPDVNDFGEAYTVEITPKYSAVTFTVPLEFNNDNYDVAINGDETEITLYGRGNTSLSSRINDNSKLNKAFLYNEEVR